MLKYSAYILNISQIYFSEVTGKYEFKMTVKVKHK